MCTFVLQSAPYFGQDGATLYKLHCSVCHDQVSSGIPPRGMLQKMSARRILRAMDAGLMMSVAAPLRRNEREAIASSLGTPGEVEWRAESGRHCGECEFFAPDYRVTSSQIRVCAKRKDADGMTCPKCSTRLFLTKQGALCCVNSLCRWRQQRPDPPINRELKAVAAR